MDYFRRFPPDAEFPKSLGQLDLFVRFFLQSCRPVTVQVRVEWLPPGGGTAQRVNTYTFGIPFAPAERVHDRAFRLVNVILPGRGTYAVKLVRQRRHRYRGPVWQRLTTDWFEVE